LPRRVLQALGWRGTLSQALASLTALGSGAAAAGAGAQVGDVGHPLVRSIAPAEYDGGLQIFAASQAPDGVLYFAYPKSSLLG